MAERNIWLDWAIELQSLAQAGSGESRDDRHESAVKEVREEAGLIVTAERIIAVQDRAKHNEPAYAWGICKIFIECAPVGGEFRENLETTASGWFGEDALPELDTEKNSEEQIRMCFRARRSERWVTEFD